MDLEPLNLQIQDSVSGSGEEHDTTCLDLEQSYDFEDDNSLNNLSSSDPNLEPYEGMEFDSEQAARIFYNTYARRIGFSIRVSGYKRSKRDGSINSRLIVCSREGFRRTRCEKSKPQRQRAITRVGCKARVTLRKRNSGKWAVTKLTKEHNHELVPADKVHCLRSHRHVSGSARSLIDTLQAAGMGPSKVMSILSRESGGISNIGFTKVDCQNYMGRRRKRTLGTGGQYLLDYLKQMQDEDPGFICAFQGDFENTSGNIFWADAKCRTNYKYFGDTVIFHTTYRTDRYRVPFAPFTGLNHHGQSVLFGCALLLNESESSFVWLFQSWLAAMSGRHPVSITTDQDRIIRSAVSHVFPETRHRFCKWNIFREALEKLSNVYQSYPTFEAEFQKCINVTETIEEFESCWESLLERYNLRDNNWLQSMYNARQQWVPVFVRDTFFGEMCITQSIDSINSFFDGYISATTHIHDLIRQYEKAITSRYEKEVKADHDTINTAAALRTPSPMEKQAANLYTREIFTKFQEELVETLANPATVVDDTGLEIIYRVAKFGEEHKAHFIRLNVFERKATCSCHMFEFSGIVCRHILAVFRVTNVLTLPSHFILKRWTRHAKSEVALDDHNLGFPTDYQDSFTARYDNLRREAVRYIERGAESISVYDVAIDALREAARKVAAAKHKVPEEAHSLVVSTSNQEVDSSKDLIGQSSLPNQDKEIQRLTAELENASQRYEAYRASLLAVLREMEEHSLKLTVKVQNARLNLEM